MPHLDAKALTSDDPKGLEFLASVLDVSVDRGGPAWTVTPDVPATKPITVRLVAARRRKAKVTVAEHV